MKMSDKDQNSQINNESGLLTQTRDETKKLEMYKVVLLNDDFTPMEFVIIVLQKFFAMNSDRATNVMLHIHQRGVGVCGVFTYEIAETKVGQVMDFSRRNEHPLQCTMEKD